MVKPHFHHLVSHFQLYTLAFNNVVASKFERNGMRSFSSKQSPYFPLVFPLHRSKKQHRHLLMGLLNRRRSAQLQEARKRMIVVKAEIEMRNLKLYIENQSIIEENEKLRKQAVLLHKENQALLSQLQKKLSEQNNNKTNH